MVNKKNNGNEVQRVVIMGSKAQAYAMRMRANINDILACVRTGEADEIPDGIARLRHTLTRFESEIKLMTEGKED